MQDYNLAITVANLQRQLNNLLRSGVICELVGVDRARVQTSDNITAPLPWFTHRAGSSAVSYWRPSVGEQVFILSPRGDLVLGVILPAIYSNQQPANASGNVQQVNYQDGATISYNPDNSTLKVAGVSKVIIEAADAVEITTATATINSETTNVNASSATVTADNINLQATALTANATDINLTAPQISLNSPLVNVSGVVNMLGLAVAGGGGAPATIAGDLQIAGSLQASGVDLVTHKHTDSEGGTTSTPF